MSAQAVENDQVIDLTDTKAVLADAARLINQLHGQDLNETAALTSQSKGRNRQERAAMSQDLQRLATRLELAAQLVRNEYWFARGVPDPLDPERTLPS